MPTRVTDALIILNIESFDYTCNLISPSSLKVSHLQGWQPPNESASERAFAPVVDYSNKGVTMINYTVLPLANAPA